jgi:DNA modification methylase
MRNLGRTFDLCLTDPPYGINENHKKVASRGNLAKPIDYGEFTWDEERLSKDYFIEMQRISRHQVIFGGNYYTDYLPASASWIVWDKENGSNDFADVEMAWTSHKKAARLFRYMWNGMLKAKPETRYHPTQKPLDLMRWILQNYTERTDIIIDPFCGSGTTGVACVLEGRDFIGIERETYYCGVARARMTRAQGQACDIPRRIRVEKDLPLFSAA